MAPTCGQEPALATYLDKDIPELIAKYDKLWEVEDPEQTPYKSKYEARKLLEEAVKKVEQLLEVETDEAVAVRGQEMMARLFLFLGKNLYFCEEVPGAERYFNRSLERYLRSPLRLEPKPFTFIQDVLNQLGMLWCNRQGFSEGMDFLRRAQIMFVNRPAAVREAMEDRARNNFTLTMFYLAQAYGALQKPALAARFCAATMSRQLEHNTGGERTQEMKERDPFDCKDWVRNCCSLSDFFINEGMFWTAEYLLHSANVMCSGCEEICGFRPENLHELSAEVLRDLGNLYCARLKFARTCLEKPEGEEAWKGERKAKKQAEQTEPSEGSRLTFKCSADPPDKPPEGGSGPIEWDAVFPEVVFLEDEEAVDNRLAEETEADGASPATAGEPVREEERDHGWLELSPGERVRLPVHFRRLHEATQRRMRRANASFLQLRGPVLSNGGTEEGHGGSTGSGDPADRALPSCLGRCFESAREIFKLASHYYSRALGHFVLDGWVTEHVRILQELSQLYKSLQFWEKDAKRSAAMLKRRAQMLAPLLDVLNPRVYIAFWKQLSFEVGEIYQELYELKASGALPGASKAAEEDEESEDDADKVKRAARCNEMARKALQYYTTFVESYHQDGKEPERIDTDNCRAYLTARLNRARLRTKMRGLGVDEELEGHKLALREYEWILGYAKRHPETYTQPEIAMEKEIRLCEEMAKMLPSKLSQIAARRRR